MIAPGMKLPALSVDEVQLGIGILAIIGGIYLTYTAGSRYMGR